MDIWNLSLHSTVATPLLADVTNEFILSPTSTTITPFNNTPNMDQEFVLPASFNTPTNKSQFTYNDRFGKQVNLTPALLKNFRIYQSLSNHQFASNFSFNESFNQLHGCPSTQMPMGNLISMILYTLVFIVGLSGNSLVIYVVLRFSKMKTVTNMYILNLAIADECFLIGIPFLLITMHLGEWTLGNNLCKAYMISTSITQFTSSIFLFIMSLDRYIAICHPISAPRIRTPFFSKVISVIAWTISVIFMLPVFLYAGIMTTTIQYTEQTKVSCIIMWPDETQTASQTTFTLYSLILGFVIPLTLILVFYYLVIRKLRTVGPKTKSKEKKRSHRKVTKLVLTVITVYILSWFPYWVSQVALINSPPGCTSRLEITVFVLVGCLGYSNSAMNPILYAFLSDNFKKSFLKACSCGKEINAQLQVQENSNFFPKFGKRGSDRVCSTSKSPNNLLKANAHNRKNLTQSNQTSTLETATLMIETAAVSRKSSINNIVASSATTLQQSHRTMSDNSLRPPVLHTAL